MRPSTGTDALLYPSKAPERKFNVKKAFIVGAVVSLVSLGAAAVASSTKDTSSVASFNTLADGSEEDCAEGPDVLQVFSAEHAVSGLEITARPDLSLHRDLLGYTDDDVKGLWQDAADYFQKELGISDLTTWEVPDTSTNIKYSPDGDWTAAPVSLNSEIRVPLFWSSIGDYKSLTGDCPVTSEVEQIRLERMTPGIVRPNLPMQVAPGDNWGYGHILTDLSEQDNGWLSIQFSNAIPIHMDTNLGGFFNNLHLSHPDFGTGQCVSAVTMTQTATGVHQSLRATMTFPATWEGPAAP